MVGSKPSDPRITVTSSEATGRKHLVQPYDDLPVVDRAARGGVCKLCGNPRFRRSRLRFGDLSHLLLLKFPVRCTRCGQRQYMGLGVASGAGSTRPQSASALRAAAEGPDSWKTWTEQSRQFDRAAKQSSADQQGSARPVDEGNTR